MSELACFEVKGYRRRAPRGCSQIIRATMTYSNWSKKKAESSGCKRGSESRREVDADEEFDASTAELVFSSLLKKTAA